MNHSYQVDVPEGVSGSWKVSRFTVSKEAAKFEAMRAIFGGSGRGVPAGTYTSLTRSPDGAVTRHSGPMIVRSTEAGWTRFASLSPSQCPGNRVGSSGLICESGRIIYAVQQLPVRGLRFSGWGGLD